MDRFLFTFPWPSYENNVVSYPVQETPLLFSDFATGAFLVMVFGLIVETFMRFGIVVSPDGQPKKYILIWLKG